MSRAQAILRSVSDGSCDDINSVLERHQLKHGTAAKLLVGLLGSGELDKDRVYSLYGINQGGGGQRSAM